MQIGVQTPCRRLLTPGMPAGICKQSNPAVKTVSENEVAQMHRRLPTLPESPLTGILLSFWGPPIYYHLHFLLLNLEN